MEVQVQRFKTLNPINDKIEPYDEPLTIFDLLESNIHAAIIYAYTAPTPSNAELIDGLSKALMHFPRLTAQLGYDHSRRPCLHMGGDGNGGALVVEATVASCLSDHLPLEPSPELSMLHPPIVGAAHLLQVQLNRFKCGGLAIAVTNHHKVCDGQSMSNFIIAWVQAVLGVPINPLPVSDKAWLTNQASGRNEFRNWNLEFVPVEPEEKEFSLTRKHVDPNEISNIMLRYSSEFIAEKLKPASKRQYSTVVTLTAHLWRKITVARGLDAGDYSMVRISVNGRPKLNPRVPKEFFGNLVHFAYSKSDVRQLHEGGLQCVTEMIHDAVVRTDGEIFKSLMDRSVMYEKEERMQPGSDVHANVLSPMVEVDSWLGFRFQEVEFGGEGRLCAMMPGWVPVEGLMMLLPSIQEDGGVDVFVTLHQDHATKLREISHSLD